MNIRYILHNICYQFCSVSHLAEESILRSRVLEFMATRISNEQGILYCDRFHSEKNGVKKKIWDLMIKSKLSKKDNETNTSLIQNVKDRVNQLLNFKIFALR